MIGRNKVYTTKNEMRLDLGNATRRNTAWQMFAELSREKIHEYYTNVAVMWLPWSCGKHVLDASWI